MSHTVKIQVQFKTAELQQLKKAFTNLGWNVRDNAEAREYSTTARYPFVAVNPATDRLAFDIGFKPNGENLDLFSDFYGGSIEAQLGKEMCRLKQEFAACVIEDEFPNSNITREQDEKGNLVLEVTQW